jgi:hypothetical protein
VVAVQYSIIQEKTKVSEKYGSRQNILVTPQLYRQSFLGYIYCWSKYLNLHIHMNIVTKVNYKLKSNNYTYMNSYISTLSNINSAFLYIVIDHICFIARLIYIDQKMKNIDGSQILATETFLNFFFLVHFFFVKLINRMIYL